MDKSARFDHGVNFAVAGATALNQSFFLERGIVQPGTSYSLEVQLQWFNAHISHICTSTEGPALPTFPFNRIISWIILLASDICI